MRADTIPARLLAQANLRPTAPAYYFKQDGVWQATTWREYAQEVRQAGKTLMALTEPGKSSVAVLGFNRPEWVIFHLGALCIGGVSTGVYTTSSAEEMRHVVDHSESVVLLLEDEVQWAKVEAERERLPGLRHVVMMRGAKVIDSPEVMSWEQFMARGDEVADEAFEERVDRLDPDAPAVLIYTSGTTGAPKGVELTHRNLAWTATAVQEMLESSSDDTQLSYLPLSHIAEQMLTINMPVTAGVAMYFAESPEKVAENLREVRPTVLFGVPRVWEKFYAAVSTKLAAATGFKKSIVEWVRTVATKVSRARNQGKEPDLVTRLQYKLADYLLLKKLKSALGMDRTRMFLSGAAPIAPDILEFFASLGIVIHEVYGQSEDCGPTTFNYGNKTKFGTVGVAISGLEVVLAEDGEILVKGPSVFRGYFKDEAATNEVLQDGWLYSGDIGEMDSEKFLTITGRKKEIIITAGGKNIAPKNIEAAFKSHRMISDAVVIGDRRKYLSALLVLSDDAVAEFLAKHGIERKALDEIPELHTAVQDIVNEVNIHLARVETIKRFTILPRAFTVESGELTPTLKLKRAVIHEHYAETIEQMYKE